MLIPQEVIANKIFLIRGKKVILDRDLAELYGVPTKSLNLAVRRNASRFPEDFMFQITKKEFEGLRFQIETSKRGGRRYLPYVFTEQGVAMLSSVLNSERAIHVNIAIMRVFVRFREVLSNHKQLAQRIVELEKRMEHKDKEIQAIFEVIRQLMGEVERPKRKIGFYSQED